ncbi:MULTISPECIES: response regulator transcription factor [unclassified Clostridium]|uniref:response regulator transcription factor n=1 Tax=unclassified Clostridium TaxID=2614128 RepID=UPI0025C3DD09|nr:response regulator transcription factor [Clostridium sp.]MDY2630116.1 response regulator transcription factor [Clostridium sp.]MDY4253248.1 response regulator transcription factor [Clostridium sp.]MDY6227569.1 response regulator transcription factor [Clostridium sp.]
MIKILFLEDEPNILEVTTEYMKMHGYEVTCVCNGEEAIEKLKNEDFNLAILDIMVPKISGLEVLQYINKNKKEMSTIMLTALGDEQTQLKAFNLKTDDFVIKPFSPILLLKRIEAVLRRSLKEENDNYTNNELYIDDKTYQAYYNNKSLNLTLSEFLLLQTLMKEPNRVFNREQLIIRIFNEDYISNDRIIDAHVKNLRKKLPNNYIKTVIGVGYQFNKEGI